MRYYVSQNNQTKGPFTLNQMQAMWNSGTITGDLLYCEEGADTWFSLSDLQPMLEPAPPHSSPQTLRSIHQQPQLVRTAKSRGIFIILGLFLGCLGLHNFYAGYHGRGAAQLIITCLLGVFVIGLVITVLWSLVEIISVSIDANGDKMS